MQFDPRLDRIVRTISGAHLYGFPSPDSDFDLREAHKVIALVNTAAPNVAE